MLLMQTGAHLSAEKVSCGCAAARCLTSMADGRVPCGISAPTKNDMQCVFRPRCKAPDRWQCLVMVCPEASCLRAHSIFRITHYCYS